MRRRFSLILLTSFLLLPQGAFSTDGDSIVYTDLPHNHVYHNGVQYLTEENVVWGYDDGSFGVNLPIRRDEALKMIIEGSFIQFEDLPVDYEYSSQFPDITEEHWGLDYIDFAYNTGVIQGYEDGYFHPERTITRAEAIKMLVVLNDEEIYDDYPESLEVDWTVPYVVFASDHALLTPNADYDFLPNQELSRGELADIIYRYQNAPYTGAVEYGVASYYGWSFDGANTASGTPLDAAGYQAAHQTLPFGTRIKVTNPNNMQSVIVEVVDRGPYVEGRVIDLTPGAFEELGELWQGLAHVYLEVLR